MTSWFEKGRPALFKALNDVCAQIDRDLVAELQPQSESKDSSAREDPAHSNLAIVGIVKNENAKLRAQLAALTAELTPTASVREHDGEPAQQPTTAVEQTSVSVAPNAALTDDTTDWKAECIKTKARFNALSTNFKRARDALQKRKDERDKWIQHAALLERKIKAAEEEHGIQILDRSKRHERATSHLAAQAQGERPSPNTSFVADVEAPTTDLPLMTETTLHTNHLPAAGAHSSDVTQGDPDEGSDDKLPPLSVYPGDDAVRVKEEPSSDGPVVVSERVVKKRKQDDAADTNPPRKIKVEQSNSSSPLLSHEHYDFNPHESIDLGEVAQKLPTPRKRKQLEDNLRLEEAAVNTPVSTFVRRDPLPQTVQPLQRSSALTPISVNRRVFQSGGGRPQARPFKAGLDRGIAFLAEDGALYGKDATGLAFNGTLATTPVAKGRLDALLNNPSSADQPVTPHETRAGRQDNRNVEHDLAIPERRELPFGKGVRQSRKPDTPVTPAARAAFPGPNTPIPGPSTSKQAQKGSRSILRSKPVSELRLDDFKINPTVNEGHDFAFSEVVRHKDDRACLPGCTDMHCCGKYFRALAASQKPDPPLTAAQRQEEQKLLEDHLGDYSYRLATMSKEERAEAWLEAKTQELANKYGKHRNRFSRMRSPPGFWDADFPNTQDLEADRAEAAKRERATVEERYREARRPGGRWVFRDE